MQIDENTKYIARLHKKPSPRGLNIYNPFFEEVNLNALYLLFYNENTKPLLDGLRNLDFLGAITAGFESGSDLPNQLDGLDPISKFVGKVGYIKNVNGKLTGYLQSGEGLLRSIQTVTKLDDKDIVIVGAGNVSKTLLYVLSQKGIKPRSITLLNRDVKKSENLASSLDLKISVKPFEEINSVSGDLLVNITDIGGSEVDTVYTSDIVNKFSSISDVTFETENTNLVNLGKQLNKTVSTGWDMFTYQGAVILETLFEKQIDATLLKKHVVNGLSSVVN